MNKRAALEALAQDQSTTEAERRTARRIIRILEGKNDNLNFIIVKDKQQAELLAEYFASRKC